MTSKQIRYDAHALRQMAARGISRQDVRTLLVMGERTKAVRWSPTNPRWRAAATLHGRPLAIYFLMYADHYYIITAMEVW